METPKSANKKQALPDPAPIVLWDRKLVGKPCQRVECFDDKLVALYELLKATAYAHRGVGLAAPQIGQFIQVAVICYPPGKPPLLLVNPEIDDTKSNGSQSLFEGCLSLPGESSNGNRIPNQGKVFRSTKLVYSYYDIRGKKIEAVEEDPMRARVIQHEFDHLRGIFFIERCTSLARGIVLGKFENFKKTLRGA